MGVTLLLLAAGVPHGPPIHSEALRPLPERVQSTSADTSSSKPPTLDTSSGVALCASLAAQLPKPTITCDTRGNRTAAGRPPLVVIVGEGKTATSSVAIAVAMLGLRSQHYLSEYRCLDLSDGPCTELWGTTNPHNPYADLVSLPLERYASYDYCSKFKHMDSYADTPMSTFAPFIYAANGPGTKVILTVRGPASWAKRRAGWWEQTGVDDSAPFAPFMRGSFANALPVPESINVDDTWTARGIYRRSHAALELLYAAQLAMYSCIVPPEDLLVIDVVAETKDTPKLWAKLASFLQRPTTGLNLSHFPRDDPLNCTAEEIKAKGNVGFLEKAVLNMTGSWTKCDTQ